MAAKGKQEGVKPGHKIKHKKKAPPDGAPDSTPMEAKPAPAKPAGTYSRVAMDRKKQALIEALEQCLGVVTTACKKVGVSRYAFYDYLKSDSNFKAAYDELSNVALDFAESKLHQRISEGSDACTIFYLKTKGKARGYIERAEVTGINGTPIAIQVVAPDAETMRAIDDI